jgi:hypothetical protein
MHPKNTEKGEEAIGNDTTGSNWRGDSGKLRAQLTGHGFYHDREQDNDVHDAHIKPHI